MTLTADEGTDTVAHALARFVKDVLGAERIFTVPGEAMLPLLSRAGAIGVDLVAMRHESGAGFAGLAEAQLRGRPSVIAVNRSPGAANVSIALDATRCDPAPVLIVVGTSPRGQDPGTGYQSRTPAAQLGGLAAVLDLNDGKCAEQMLQEAARCLGAWPPRPVVLAIPQDVWALPYPGGESIPQMPEAGCYRELAAADVHDLARRLADATAPVLVAGQLLRHQPSDDSSGLLTTFAARACVPVLLGNKRQDVLDNIAPCYAGDIHQGTHPRTRDRLSTADLVMFLGDLPWEVHTNHWHTDQELITIHPEPTGPGRLLIADPLTALGQLIAASWPAPTAKRQAWLRDWRALEVELSTPHSRILPDGVDLTEVIAELDQLLDHDAVVCLDAGNFGSWVHRYLRFTGQRRLLAVADGSMGSGIPGAIAASLAQPGRQIVAVVGDGGLLMTGNELAVPVGQGRRPVVIVADNQGYGAIRSQGARVFPGQDVAAELVSPDIAAWARCFGYPAERVTSQQEVAGAVRRALSAPHGYLLHVVTSPTAVHANFDLPGPRGPRPGTHAVSAATAS
jgi:acetolactate synthase I/II/III large subunit